MQNSSGLVLLRLFHVEKFLLFRGKGIRNIELPLCSHKKWEAQGEK